MCTVVQGAHLKLLIRPWCSELVLFAELFLIRFGCGKAWRRRRLAAFGHRWVDARSGIRSADGLEVPNYLLRDPDNLEKVRDKFSGRCL